KNPFAAEALGSGFRLSIEEKFDRSFVLGDMSAQEYALNIGVMGTLGKYANTGLNNANIGSLRPYFSRWGINFAEGTSSYGVNMLTNTIGNVTIPAIILNTSSDTTNNRR